MTTMAVLNHTEEELDDDIVSNLSLNLMVSDNEDGGSPTSDRFDKLDSRNESPEDSNNCDNSEEAKMTCDDIPNNEMKDDLQQLRDITGDSSWSAVDDSDSYDFSIDIDNAIPTKTENKESTSNDTEPTIKEDNTKITMDEDKLEAIEENRDPSAEEEEAIAKKNTEEDSEENLDNQNFTKEPEEKDEEMENEERLLNDIKDNEKEAEDCEHLDEDALLSDPRDEDLLQITEEKSAENDTADFLRCCQEEQEANENSCSSTEKGEDNHSEFAGEYEESNTDAFESDDTVTNDNYENGDIDNDTSGYDLNLVKCEDVDDAQGGSNGEPDIVDEEMTDANVTENEESSMISENNIGVPETNSMEYFNGDADNLVASENNPDETEEYTEACEEETRVESADNIEQSTDAEQLDDRQEEYEKVQSTESDLDKETSTMENMSHRSEPVLSGMEASTKKITITEVKSCGDEGAAEESTDMLEATDENFETTEEAAEECNNIVESSERTITEECNDIEATTDTADAPRHEENEMLSGTVEESIKSETVSCNNNILCEREVTNENEALPDIVKESELFLPLETTAKENVRMEGDESEDHMQTENDIVTGNQVEKNDAVLNITNDTDELPTEDFTTDNDELSTEGITIAKKELDVVEDIPIAKGELTVEDTTIANEDLIVEDITNAATEDLAVEDFTNAKEDLIVEDITNAKEVAVKNINPDKNEEIEADSMAEISEDAKKLKETDDEPMEVDDMDLDALSIQSCIDDNAPCITNIPVVKHLIDNTSERTNKPNTITIHNQIDLEGKTDTNTCKKEDESITNLELILDDTKPKTPTTNNVLDENIINLIDDCETEVIAGSAQQTDAIKLQNLAADSTVSKHTIDTAQLQNFTNAVNIVKPPSGIEGDNKECEDMDIEVITPYKESVTRPNGSVLKQILVTKNIPSTLSSTSPIISLPTTDGKQNTKTYFIVSPISNTIADNNIAVVSPQPGEKRLSSDNFQTENAKRRRLTAPGVKETRQKYLEQFKQAMATTNWSRIGRRQLEEFATQKLLEAMHYKTGIGELHKKCTEYKQSLENLRTNSLTLTKQLRDMNSVHIKLEREINILKARHRNDDKPLVAVKITRSVGLQAMVEDPKTNRRPRSNNVGGSARTSAQKQPLQVAQQQQQIHPPQLQQKPMSQQPPVQVQVPQRVVVGTGNSPQLQPRPAPRPLVSHPSVATPVQTRTMSRNKKVQLPTIVNSVNPPPLRSINQQQSTAITTIPTNSTTIGIPIKHITGPTILNKTVGVPIQTVATPIVTTTEVSKGVIDLTDEDDVGKKLSPLKNTSAPQQQQQQQRITLMSTVVNGQQVLLRVVTPVSQAIPPFTPPFPFTPTCSPMSYAYRYIQSMHPASHHMNTHVVLADGGGPIPNKAATALTNGTPLFVQSPMMQQRVSASNAIKMVAGVPLRTRTSSAVQTPAQQTNNAPPPPNTAASRRFRHPAPLPAPPSSQSLIKGNKPIPPKPTVTVNKSPNGSGIIVKWNMPSMLSLFEKIVRYELFVYQVTKSPPRTDSWGKINDVGALDLPMAVSLTEFAEGNRYYFAVRAVDELGRLGPFSEPQTIVF